MTQCPQKMEQLKPGLEITDRFSVCFLEAPPLSSRGQNGSQTSTPYQQTSGTSPCKSAILSSPPRGQGLLVLQRPGWGGGGEETGPHLQQLQHLPVASRPKALENVSRKQVGTEGSYEVPESPAEKERTGTHTCAREAKEQRLHALNGSTGSGAGQIRSNTQRPTSLAPCGLGQAT